MNNKLPPFEYSLSNICENIKNEAAKNESADICIFTHIHEAAYAMSGFFPQNELFFTSESFLEFYTDAVKKLFDCFREYSVFDNPNTLSGSNILRNAILRNAVLRSELTDALTKIFAQMHGFADKENRNNIYAGAFLNEIVSGSGFNAFSSEPIPDYPEIKNTVAYVENIYSAAAFKLFCSGNAEYEKVLYTDFNTMCEDVFDGEIGGCILPVRSSESGSLSGFRSLIDNYDLKIAQSCNIMTDPAQSGSAHTEFVLLQKNLSCPDDIRSDIGQSGTSAKNVFAQNEKRLRLNAKIILPDLFPVGALISSAEYLGADTVEINSLPVLYDSAPAFNAVFEANIASVPSLLAFFFLETPQFTPHGIYYPINTN